MERQQVFAGLRTVALGRALLTTALRAWSVPEAADDDAEAALAQTLVRVATEPGTAAADRADLLLGALADTPRARARVAAAAAAGLHVVTNLGPA
jgi:hypothetical protein